MRRVLCTRGKVASSAIITASEAGGLLHTRERGVQLQVQSLLLVRLPIGQKKGRLAAALKVPRIGSDEGVRNCLD